MAYSQLHKAGTTSGIASATPWSFGWTPTTGNLLVLTIYNITNGTQPTSVTDGNSVGLTLLNSAAHGTSYAVFHYAYIVPATPSTTIQSTLTSASWHFDVAEYSGNIAAINGTASTFIDNGQATSNGSITAAATTNGSQPSVTTTNAGDLIITSVGLNGSAGSSSITPTGATLNQDNPTSTTLAADAYQIETTTGTYSPYFSWTTSTRTSAQITTALLPASAPKVTVSAASSISNTYVIGNGNITSVGNGPITASGFVWNTTGSPTTSDSIVSTGPAVTGAYSIYLNGLTAATTYYYRAYATNSIGTTYSTAPGTTFTTTNVTPSGNSGSFLPFM